MTDEELLNASMKPADGWYWWESDGAYHVKPEPKQTDERLVDIIQAPLDFIKGQAAYASEQPADFLFDWSPLSLINLPYDVLDMAGANTAKQFMPNVRPLFKNVNKLLQPQTVKDTWQYLVLPGLEAKAADMAKNPEDYPE